MSIEKLKAARDKVHSEKIGLYLQVTKNLLAVIDEHIAESELAAELISTATNDSALQARAEQLEAQVASLESELIASKVEHAAKEAAPAPVVEAEVIEHKAEPVAEVEAEAAPTSTVEQHTEQQPEKHENVIEKVVEKIEQVV